MPFTNKPWDGSASRFPDAAAYCRSALIDENPSGEPKTKARCYLPVREPDGTYNVNAVRAALAVLGGARGGVGASPASRQRAQARARALLAEAGGQPAARENRTAGLVETEIKGRTLHGYAAVYDSPWSDNLIEEMGYVERIARGAFRKALARSDNVPLLWQHDRRDVLATTRAGTLRLREDGKGLAIQADLPNTTLGNDVREMVQRRDVQGMSYGIATARGDSEIDWRTQPPTRLVKNAQRLLDVTLTWEPSYPSTEVELRTMAFAALPLQEIAGGPEGQTGEAVTEDPSLEANQLFRRLAEIRLGILEQGGILDEGGRIQATH